MELLHLDAFVDDGLENREGVQLEWDGHRLDIVLNRPHANLYSERCNPIFLKICDDNLQRDTVLSISETETGCKYRTRTMESHHHPHHLPSTRHKNGMTNLQI